MKYKIGIDVGGRFTDFLLTMEDATTQIYKVLSTPDDPSIATMESIQDMARDRDISTKEFLRDVTVIVHGTTVTTNPYIFSRTFITVLIANFCERILSEPIKMIS